MILERILSRVHMKRIPSRVESKGERDCFILRQQSPVVGNMAATSEGGMSLRLRGESKVQARRPSCLSAVQLSIQGRVWVQIVEY